MPETSTAVDPERRRSEGRDIAAKGVLGALAAALVVGVALFLVLGNVLQETTEDVGPVTDAGGEKVSQEVYEDVELGLGRQEVLTLLRPAFPIESAQLSRYRERPEETAGSSCVYYEAGGGLADDLYRFCLADDELVDKTVILPDERGPAG